MKIARDLFGYFWPQLHKVMLFFEIEYSSADSYSEQTEQQC